MPDITANLALPFILPAQAQKHVTHNEALLRLDVLVQAAVQDRDRTAPPASPLEGQCHLVAPGASGVWAGQEGRIAAFIGNGWEFLAPRPGWRLRVLNSGEDLLFDAGGWQVGSEAMLRAAGLGLNATADSANRLTVSAEATLLNHAGAGHQLKVNKATAGDTASLLFQTGFAGRAEMGLAGNDDFSIKVSADGSAFAEALRIDRVTGRPNAPQGLGVTGQITGTAVSQGLSDTTPGRLLTVGAGHAQLDNSLYRRGNALGSVSQSGGIPTGALMERGSNANGDYLRLADGTQLCWGSVTIAPVANSPTASTWIFPAAFAGSGTISVTTSANSSVPGMTVLETGVNAIGTTSCDLMVYRTNTTNTNLRAIAIGRWF